MSRGGIAIEESVTVGEVEAEQFHQRRDEKHSVRARSRFVSGRQRAIIDHLKAGRHRHWRSGRFPI